MRLNNLLVEENQTLREALEKIDLNGLGVVFVIDKHKILIGILTDGDIRRLLLKGKFLEDKVEKLYKIDYTFRSITSSTEEILTAFTNGIRIVPLINEEGVVIDYASQNKPRNISIAEPSLMGNELTYVSDCINTGWISSQGTYVSKFEKDFSSYLNRPSLSVSNGTVAIHLALLTLGIKKDDEVIVPDLTFAATINAVLYCGATPVIADVNPKTWNLDLESIKKVITKKTKGIIVVHLYGNPCEIDPIINLCKEENIYLIEDCAESIGSYHKSKPTGSFGDAATFSFFGNKTITTGEGGMVVFKSEINLEKAKILRDHGMSKTKRYWHDVIGYNYRLTNLQAAVGVAQLERLNNFVSRKQTIANEYLKGINFQKAVYQELPPNSSSSFWLFSIILESEGLRDSLINYLLSFGIETRKVFYSLSNMPIYKKYCEVNCIHSKRISSRGMSLPTYPGMTPDQVEFIIDRINTYLND